jgi:hypothetical protein
MSLSNEFETRILQWALTTGSPTRPTAWYIGLYTDNPGETGAGTEISGNGYARESVTFTVSGDTASNNADIEFSTATGSWGTITHIAVLDALTSGNVIAYGALSASKAIGNGDIFRIAFGDLDITLD